MKKNIADEDIDEFKLKRRKKKKIRQIIYATIVIVLIIALVILGDYTCKLNKIIKENEARQSEEEVRIYNAKLQEEKELKEKEEKEAEYQKYLEENVLDNDIPIALYIRQGNSLIRADEIYCNWARDSVLGIFYTFPSNEGSIPLNGYYSTLWENKWKELKTQGYKIGYQLKLKLDTGEEINRTLRDPVRVEDEIFSHIQIYFYDDVTYMPGRPYYHMTPEEVTEQTLFTSVKLVGYKETKGVNGPIELTVFTYNGDEDFDKTTGEYIGESKFLCKLYRQQV